VEGDEEREEGGREGEKGEGNKMQRTN